VPGRLELLAWVEEQGARLTRGLEQGLRQREQRLRDLARALPRADMLLQTPRQRLDAASDALPRALQAGVQTRRVALSETSGSLRASTLTRMIENRREALGRRAARLTPVGLQRDITRRREKLQSVVQRLQLLGERRNSNLRSKLDGLANLSEAYSYTNTLQRGFALVRGDGKLVKTAAAAGAAKSFEIEFADGCVTGGEGTAVQTDASAVEAVKPAPKPAPKPKSKTTEPPEQGSLF
jgi:exodeoxyribonuclease VII large subunit